MADKDKLDGTNFMEWFHRLRRVLKETNKLYVIEQPLPSPSPPKNSNDHEKRIHSEHVRDTMDVAVYISQSMTRDIRKCYDKIDAYDTVRRVKEMYETKVNEVRYDLHKQLFSCKMREGTPVKVHVRKMIDMIDRLRRIGFPMSLHMETDIVLQSLPNCFSGFITDYNKKYDNVELSELLELLVRAEDNMLISKPLSMTKDKAPIKRKEIKKRKNYLKPKSKVVKDWDCYLCGKKGHMKRSCPVHLQEVARKKKEALDATSTSGMI